MYVCMVITYSRVWINRVRLPILLVVSWTAKIIFPCPCACLRIWSREAGSAVPSRISLLISILRLKLVLILTGFLPSSAAASIMKPPYAIGSVPSLSGHTNAYRWRSLPRVRRHRSSKPQGSSERVLSRQITMDQLIFVSLSHTHYWYEVGMLKVPRRLPILLVVSWTGKITFPCPRACLRIWSPTRVQPSHPASACSSPYSGWIWCLLAGFLPSSAAASIYETAIRHRVSPEFIGSRNCVPMAFTTESPPAQGQ